MNRLTCVGVAWVCLFGCGDDPVPGEELVIDVSRPECENLHPRHCLMPYPTTRYLREDATTDTGFRVDLPVEAIPHNQFDSPAADMGTWNRFDGFSPMGSLIMAFDGKVDDSNLADDLNIGDSLLPTSPTVIIDADTGEWVAHIAEIDKWPRSPADETSFYMRPAQRLLENHRYIAAIRNIALIDGSPVEPSDYFRALRDDIATEVAEVEARRPEMETMFTTLAGAGVAREDLVIAWEFHTASGPSLYGEMLQIRDDGFQRFNDRTDGVGTCTVTSVEEDVNGEIWRRVRGTYTVPLYMTHEYEGSIANRDASGEIAFLETTEAPFELVIPPSVRDRVMNGDGPGRGLMYGHGLLGSAGQVSSGGTRVALQRSEMVGFGTDYWGLAEGDEAQFITHVVTQFDNFRQLGERLMQGTLNSLILQKTFATGGPCSEIAELQLAVGDESRPLLKSDEMYYYGISQGGIMGATLAALSDTIDRYVLQVGAVGYSTLVRRSIDFEPFELIFALWYTEKLDRDWFIISTQTMWDLAEPSTYVPHILEDPLPGVDISERRILYQTALFDAQVSNAASDMAARTMNLPVFSSSVYEPWGVAEGILQSTAGPADSGYIIYALDTVDPIPYGTAIADEDNDAHNDLRYLDPMLDQLDAFCRPDGQVVDFCPAGSCALVNTR